MTTLLPAIAPVSLIILIGFVAGRTVKLEHQPLSQLVLYILVPALIVSSLYHSKITAESAIALVIAMVLTTTLLYLTVLLLSRLCQLPANLRKSLVATTLVGNVGNLGLPIIAFAFGEAGLERAVIVLITASMLMAGVGPALLKEQGIQTSVTLTLKLPLVWAMLGGMLLRNPAVQLPLSLIRGIEMLGNAAIPVALVTLGMQLAKIRIAIGRYELLVSGLRLLYAPLLAYGVGYILKLQELDLQVLVMQSAMPAAVNSLIWASEFGGDPPRVARAIMVSTVISLVSLPAALWWLTSP